MTKKAAYQDMNRLMPLLAVCRKGRVGDVNKLLKCGVDVNQDYIFRDGGSNTIIQVGPPVWEAIVHGRMDIVKILVANNAALNPHGERTPLLAACKYNRHKIVPFLIERGADIEFTKHDGYTYLMMACKRGNYELVNHLLSAGANIHRQDERGYTALHACVSNYRVNSLRLMRLLISHGARMDADITGMTPLISAALLNRASMVTLLASHPTCAQDDKINALELLGCTFIDRIGDGKYDPATAFKTGIKYWRKALLELQSVDDGTSEVSTMQQFDERYFFDLFFQDSYNVRVQSVLVRRRILDNIRPQPQPGPQDIQ